MSVSVKNPFRKDGNNELNEKSRLFPPFLPRKWERHSMCRQKWREEWRPLKIFWREKQLFHRKKEFFSAASPRPLFTFYGRNKQIHTYFFGERRRCLRYTAKDQSYGLRKEEKRKIYGKDSTRLFSRIFRTEIKRRQSTKDDKKKSLKKIKCDRKRNCFWSFY